MIISVSEVKKEVALNGWTDAKIERKLKAIEQTIRKYTNNNFQLRTHRKAADIVGGLLVFDKNDFFKIEDTIQISESNFSNGIYTVIESSDDSIGIDKDILDEEGVLVTKVVYPDDVVDCAINLLEWSKKYGGKVGVKSETLSRHSVTYEDSATLYDGYPVGLLSGLNKYRKARF